MEDGTFDWDTTDIAIELYRASRGAFIVWVVSSWDAAHNLLDATAETPVWDEIGFAFDFGGGRLTITTPDKLSSFECADLLIFDPREGGLRIDPFADLIRRSGKAIIALDEDEAAYMYGDFGHGEEFAL